MGEIVPIEWLRRRKRKPRMQPERITPEALMELIGRHSFCVLDQHQPNVLVEETQAQRQLRQQHRARKHRAIRRAHSVEQVRERVRQHQGASNSQRGSQSRQPQCLRQNDG